MDRPMISGLSAVHNGVQRGYPFIEAIKCLLAVCDEVVVVDAASTDETRAAIEAIGDPKIRIVTGTWRRPRWEGDGGFQISENQNIGFRQCQYPWVFLLQADEGFHEKWKEQLWQTIAEADKDPVIQGLRFKYYHFWGCYTRRQPDEDTFFYKESCRVFRRSEHMVSMDDGLGWNYKGREVDSQRMERHEIVLPQVVDRKTDMYIYHYGYVNEPTRMSRKQLYCGGVFHTDEWLATHNYPTREDQIIPFHFGLEGATEATVNFPREVSAHPAPWRERILREQAEGWIPEIMKCTS